MDIWLTHRIPATHTTKRPLPKYSGGPSAEGINCYVVSIFLSRHGYIDISLLPVTLNMTKMEQTVITVRIVDNAAATP